MNEQLDNRALNKDDAEILIAALKSGRLVVGKANRVDASGIVGKITKEQLSDDINNSDYRISVGNEAGSDGNTIYFVI